MAAQHYQEALRSLLPAFREVEVANLNRPDVERFIQDRAQRYSRATLRSLRTTLSLVLGYARDNDWIDKNPVTGVKPPRTESCGGNPITRAVLTSGQVRLLADNLREPFSTLVLTLATTGLRIGEAAGLRWSDLDGNQLQVTAARVRRCGG